MKHERNRETDQVEQQATSPPVAAIKRLHRVTSTHRRSPWWGIVVISLSVPSGATTDGSNIYRLHLLGKRIQTATGRSSSGSATSRTQHRMALVHRRRNWYLRRNWRGRFFWRIETRGRTRYGSPTSLRRRGRRRSISVRRAIIPVVTIATATVVFTTTTLHPNRLVSRTRARLGIGLRTSVIPLQAVSGTFSLCNLYDLWIRRRPCCHRISR